MNAKRFARHPYDLAQLELAGCGDRAIADRKLIETVSQNKAMLYREKDKEGKLINFRDAAVNGKVQIIPNREARKVLEIGYMQMIKSQMIHGDSKPFGEVMESCARIETEINRKSMP